MRIERHGALRSRGHITVAHAPAHVYGADKTNYVVFALRGRYGVPDRGTTHRYTVVLAREEIVEALKALIGGSDQPNLAKPVISLLRELLTRKTR